MARHYSLHSFPLQFFKIAEFLRGRQEDFEIPFASEKEAERTKFQWYRFLIALGQAGNDNWVADLRRFRVIHRGEKVTFSTGWDEGVANAIEEAIARQGGERQKELMKDERITDEAFAGILGITPPTFAGKSEAELFAEEFLAPTPAVGGETVKGQEGK